MSFIDDLCAWIVSQTNSGLVAYPNAGFNAFTGTWPDSASTTDLGMALFETPNAAPQYVMGSQEPNNELALVQVQFRATDYTAAVSGAFDVYTSCGGATNVTTGSTHIVAMLAKQRPYLLRRDDKFRPYVACTYEIMKAPGA